MHSLGLAILWLYMPSSWIGAAITCLLLEYKGWSKRFRSKRLAELPLNLICIKTHNWTGFCQYWAHLFACEYMIGKAAMVNVASVNNVNIVICIAVWEKENICLIWKDVKKKTKKTTAYCIILAMTKPQYFITNFTFCHVTKNICEKSNFLG